MHEVSSALICASRSNDNDTPVCCEWAWRLGMEKWDAVGYSVRTMIPRRTSPLRATAAVEFETLWKCLRDRVYSTIKLCPACRSVKVLGNGQGPVTDGAAAVTVVPAVLAPKNGSISSTTLPPTQPSQQDRQLITAALSPEHRERRKQGPRARQGSYPSAPAWRNRPPCATYSIFWRQGGSKDAF